MRHHFWDAPEQTPAPSLQAPIVFERVDAPRPRWEYRVLTLHPETDTLPKEAELNALGAEGWLLVSVSRPYGSAGPVEYLFVRQSKEA